MQITNAKSELLQMTRRMRSGITQLAPTERSFPRNGLVVNDKGKKADEIVSAHEGAPGGFILPGFVPERQFDSVP